MKLREILTVAKYLFLSRFDKSTLGEQLEHERDILNLIATLPMKYTCKQVERALKTAKATPEMICVSLATGEHTDILNQFYASLWEQSQQDRLHVNDGEEELREQGWNGEDAW